ncbi:aromatic ring-hydroxylating dioxygenase subunit alpha [Actinomadura sp. DC4]|uniref:aromatic ring-hydroxylating oxygenase subunit alpha n=1 Tax=Actinomadura sp. DC4 TaxID=3055069 RepID=UPI0025AFB394|nr:aromatic ring-hydroxylating dioxygenase subunit alpha [Actinomadura sp. DC4]MDN3356307.1 aromatic ring-hydroxylating dioxygenase subunit alpha [Actinomadura sp. DC4]
MSIDALARPLPYAGRTLPPPPPGCTFDPGDWQIIARFWYPIALSADVTEQPLGVTLLDRPLVAYRFEGRVVVADDLCPHRGMRLSKGRAIDDGRGIKCPYHGLRFAAAGRCVSVPAHPDSKIPARMNLRAYGAVERYGLVWTCLASLAGDPEERAAIPPVPHWDDEGYQRVTCPAFDVAAFAGRQVEGFLDVAHFGFVHEATFGDPSDVEVPPYEPVPTEDGFGADYRSTVGNYPHGSQVGEPGFLWLRRFRLHVPFTATLVVHFPGGGRLSIMNAASPVSARRTRMFSPIAKNFDTGQDPQEVLDFNLWIFEEDRAVVEAQKPENLPLDPRLEVHIPADRSSIAYRRALRGLGLSRFFTA